MVYECCVILLQYNNTKIENKVNSQYHVNEDKLLFNFI